MHAFKCVCSKPSPLVSTCYKTSKVLFTKVSPPLSLKEGYKSKNILLTLDHLYVHMYNPSVLKMQVIIQSHQKALRLTNLCTSQLNYKRDEK